MPYIDREQLLQNVQRLEAELELEADANAQAGEEDVDLSQGMDDEEGLLILRDCIKYIETEYDREVSYRAFKPETRTFNRLLQRGRLYHVFLDTKTIADEMRGDHFGVVIQNNALRNRGTVIVVPLTNASTQAEKILAQRAEGLVNENTTCMVPLTGGDTKLTGFFNLRQMRAVSYARIETSGIFPVDYGSIGDACMNEIERGLEKLMDFRLSAHYENLQKAKKEEEKKIKNLRRHIFEAVSLLDAARNPRLNAQEYVEKALQELNDALEL